MKALKISILAAAAFAFLATVAGCGGGGEQYGAAISATDATPLSVILSDPATHDGSTVKVTGEIATECPSGCWFDLREGEAVVRVDLAPHGIAIPQRVGSNVVVEGTVRVTDGRVMILGEGVELR
jgi:hypothetical protein